MAEHTWERTDGGVVDDFVYDYANHNGPRCTVCGFFFCEHCWPEGRGEQCPGVAPDGFEYDWAGNGTTREPEEPQLYPVGA